VGKSQQVTIKYTNVVKHYAPYLETAHNTFITEVGAFANRIASEPPVYETSSTEIDASFFGIGYVVSNFTSLYQMFGNHMAGLDIEDVWNSKASSVFNAPEVDNREEKEKAIIDDKILTKDLSDFCLHMRELNAVQSSSFVIGKAQIENNRVKALSEISLANKEDTIPIIGRLYETELNQKIKTVTIYAQLIKKYYTFKPLADARDSKLEVREILWPFTVLEFERSSLGVFHGIHGWDKKETRERSYISKVLSVGSDTVTGAIVGFKLGGWVGAIVGAEIGTHIGIAKMMAEGNATVMDYVEMFALPSPFAGYFL